jgi:hypothetical protein
MNIRNVSFHSIEILIRLCNTNDYRAIPFIKSLYENISMYYDDNIQFALDIGLLDMDEKVIKLKCEYINAEILKQEIRRRIINQKKVSLLFHEFLNKFILINDEYIYKPDQSEMIKYSGVRNILTEINLITYHEGVYIANKELKKEKKSGGYFSPNQLHEQIKRREQIGLYAEQCVFEYEYLALSKYNNLKKVVKIEHVSKINTNAGYDIISFSRKAAINDLYNPIYIEVKAVDNDYGFYWSRNEIKVSKEISDNYYLYLVPIYENKANLEKMIIIKNPYINLLENNDWIIENESISVRKKGSTDEEQYNL